MVSAAPLDGPAWESERRWLWSVCYRLTGVAADADDLVQETWLRAVERPPADRDRPWRPWLTRVAVNLARDRLRARRRHDLAGAWLPSPVAEDRPDDVLGVRESASFALLLAMESLTPTQRAVLVLREVAGLDVAETAAALGQSPTTVKVTHHRARRALADAPTPPLTADRDLAWATFHRLLGALAGGDPEAVRAVLTDDITATADGGGIYAAARRPIRGAGRVARFYATVSRRDGAPADFALGWFNGLPGLAATVVPRVPRWPPRWVLLAAVTPEGRIGRLYTVSAPRKLA